MFKTILITFFILPTITLSSDLSEKTNPSLKRLLENIEKLKSLTNNMNETDLMLNDIEYNLKGMLFLKSGQLIDIDSQKQLSQNFIDLYKSIQAEKQKVKKIKIRKATFG